MRNVSASEEDKVRERVELGRGWGEGGLLRACRKGGGGGEWCISLTIKKGFYNMDVVQVRPLRLPSRGFSETSRAPLDGRAARG